METIVKTATGAGTPVLQNWTLDKAHAKLGFNVTHMLVSEVHGSFKNFEASIKTTGEGFENAQIELTADVSSINTDNNDRDNHLKTPDFFDAANFPTISFTSKSVERVSDNNYILSGNLTIANVTRPVKLDVLSAVALHPFNQKTIAGFKVTGSIKRSDFNLASSVPGIVVSDKVEILANAEFIKE